MQTLDDFFSNFQQAILDEASSWTSDSSESAYKENAFTTLVVEDFSEAGILESPIVCYHELQKGNSTLKVNAYSIPEEDSRLDLVIADYHSEEQIQKLSAAEIEKKLSQASRFLEYCIDGGYQSVDPSSDAFAMMKLIFDFIKSIDRVNIVLISNAQSVARKDSAESKIIKDVTVNFDIWDVERLRRFRSRGSDHEPIEVNVLDYLDAGIKCVSAKNKNFGYMTSVAIIPGKLLYHLYDKYGSRLLELNVRSYLQARTKINAGILETIATSPERFLTYNNGITVVAEDVAFDESGGEILRITGMQIVNGGQTTASIHRAVKSNKVPVEEVFVQAKITIVPPSDFDQVVPLISKYSNTQNKVSDVDLRANHPFHVGLERVSKRVWVPGETSMWFYERARGSYQTERSKALTRQQKAKFDIQYPPNQKITKEDVARFSNSWAGLPHIVSKGGQKNFTRFMETIGASVSGDWEPSLNEYKELIAKAIFHKSTQRIAIDLKIPAFRVNVVNYTASLIIEKCARRINLEEIWNRQALSQEMQNLIKDWMPKVQDLMLGIAHGRNPGEVFKEEACWSKVKEATKAWSLSSSIATKLVSVSSTDSFLDIESENNIAKCMEITAKEWFDISQWGRESNQLEPWEMGIANTLAGQANLGWQKKPSEKQAKHGVSIINRYQKGTSGK